MRAVLLCGALIGGAFLCPAEGLAQTLWQNLNVGMTPKEVATAQPSARNSEKPDHLASGAVCALTIEKESIDDHDYKVCLFFKDNKLEQVMISSIGAVTSGQFQSLIVLLRSKYGPELSNDVTSIGHNVNWVQKNGTNISVIYLDKITSDLNINYQARMSKEADKL